MTERPVKCWVAVASGDHVRGVEASIMQVGEKNQDALGYVDKLDPEATVTPVLTIK